MLYVMSIVFRCCQSNGCAAQTAMQLQARVVSTATNRWPHNYLW